MPRETPPRDEEQNDAFLVRHSKSSYATYAAAEASDPQAAFNPAEQVTPDLTPEGRELAREKAAELLDSLDPQKDRLFFVSSNEARALETADIYRQVAHERGFTIIKPENTRNPIQEQAGGDEVRVLQNLSLNARSTLLLSLFQQEKGARPINWEGVDPETRAKWEAAREIIKKDDGGSFGSNFVKHADAIKEIFPDVETARELFDKNFRNIMRMAQWAEGRFNLRENNIKIIGFGHENYALEAMNRYFEENGVNNCEAIGISLGDGGPELSFRGKTAQY